MREINANCGIYMHMLACESLPSVASPTRTPDQLIARLKEVTGAKTDWHLAVELDVPLRSLGDWKKGKGMKFETAMYLLDRAGWLCFDGDGATNRAEMRQMREELRQIRLLAEQLERRASP
jgi:hypothetical protein